MKGRPRTRGKEGAGRPNTGKRGRNGAVVAFFPDVRAKRDKPDVDAFIARVAARQHGVVSLAQLHAAGLSSSSIDRRVANARLHRIHRRVYAVGHRHLSEKGGWMAAVLACGDGAVLSHLSAAELWGIHRRVRRPLEAAGLGEVPDVHVTVPSTTGMRKRRGIILHRSTTLIARQSTSHDGIPVTKPTRTLADIRRLLSPAQFASALREAEFLRLPVDQEFESDRARTDLEQAMLAICRHHRLPRPDVNVQIDRYEVDFLWRDQRLIVEVDGWEAHRSRSAFEEDRARDARLTVLGYEVLRFTWRQVTEDAARLAATIRSLLEAKAA
jgi:very-short-patch-repair endonuclease